MKIWVYTLHCEKGKTIAFLTVSVADPGCLSRIPDPTFFHPGSWIRTVSIPDPGSRIRIKEFKYFNPKETKKMVSKLQKIWFGLFIPDPGSVCWLSTHPGSRGQKGTGSRIGIRNTAYSVTSAREAEVIIQTLAHVYHHNMYTHCTLLMTSRSGESKITRNKWRGEGWGFHLGIMSQAPALSPSFPQSHVSDLLTPRKLWFSLSPLRTSDPITIGSFIVTKSLLKGRFPIIREPYPHRILPVT